MEVVDEAAETVVSEDSVRRRGDSRGGGGGVGGGEMLERLELTAESLSLSSSAGRRPGAEALLLAVESLYSKLRSDLGTGCQCHVNFLHVYSNKFFPVPEFSHSGYGGYAWGWSVYLHTRTSVRDYLPKFSVQFPFENQKGHLISHSNKYFYIRGNTKFNFRVFL